MPEFLNDIIVDGKIIKKGGLVSQFLMADGTTSEGVSSTKVRVITIPKSSLTTVDKAGVIAYLNANGFTKYKIETLIINIEEGVVSVGITVLITIPTEGAEVQSDFTSLFQLDGTNGINISNVTEGQEIVDMTINIELT